MYLYPGVKEEVDEKRYLHRAEKLHTPVLPLECGRTRGVENRDFIREDRHSDRCWVTIATFNSLYPEIAEAIGVTLRSNIRESLPLENWEGTPVQVIARAVMVVMAPPLILFAVTFEAEKALSLRPEVGSSVGQLVEKHRNNKRRFFVPPPAKCLRSLDRRSPPGTAIELSYLVEALT